VNYITTLRRSLRNNKGNETKALYSIITSLLHHWCHSARVETQAGNAIAITRKPRYTYTDNEKLSMQGINNDRLTAFDPGQPG